MRKKPFTLLECVIAFALTAVLLSVLFSFYRQNSLSQVKLLHAKQKILERLHVQERLSSLFRNATLSKGEDSSYFYSGEHIETKGKALYFTFDNGFDPDKDFCDQIEAVLFLNKEDDLCLLIQSKEKTQRRETLLKKAESLEFHFFDPLTLDWTKKWEESQEGLPPLVKLSIKQDKKMIDFAFTLAAVDDEIIYERKGL